MAYFEPCPRCGADDISGNRHQGFAHCEACGFESATGEALPAVTSTAVQDTSAPHILPLQQWPSVIALPLRDYLEEREPVLKLWHACDVVELLLRLLVTVGLADLRRHGELPQSLLQELRPRIEEPTLGKWQGMALAIARHLKPTATVVPELPNFVRDMLLPLLDAPSGSPRTAETSFSALRNQLAHGGGVTRAVGTLLLKRWEAPVVAMLAHATWLTALDLVVKDRAGGFGVLRGPTTQATPYIPADHDALRTAFQEEDDVVLVRGAHVLPLWPLKLYGLPRSLDPDAPTARTSTPQIYVRRGEVHLQFTPVGSTEVCQSEADETALDTFRALFRLDEAAEEAKARGFAVRGFEADIRRDAERLVGRADALATLHAVLSGTPHGVLWMWGAAGIGKSYVLARLVVNLLDTPPPHTLVLPYRFKIGDDRCTRDSFLRFAIERLEAWSELPPAADEPTERDRQPRLLETLRALLRRLDGRRVLFVLDGLDEIAERDARFATEVPLALHEPGMVWLCAGRPERGLPEVLTPECTVQPFAHGLPPMDSGDIRTMLLEKIGTRRKQLLKNDQEAGEQILNPFVECVAQAAQGLPLYVTYVVGDILSNRFRMLDAGERLPPSLAAYHEELLRRCAVSTLHQVITPLAATLAAAHEPLTPAALAVVLHRRTLVPDGERGVQVVYQGLSALASMLRRALTPDGAEGYTLYHHSLRQHMGESATTRDAVALARQALCQAALQVGDDAATPYLYRQGITHLLEMGGTDEACGLLTNFTYLMARLRTLPEPGEVAGLSADWRALLGKVGAMAGEARLWEAFFHERAHMLRRGDADWPAYKIWLQLAVEHADNSPVTQAAEAWLEQGMCDWMWLRRVPRVAHTVPSPCLRVFEEHTGRVEGALALRDGRLLSWGWDGTLRFWDSATGAMLATLAGHIDVVWGVLELRDGRLLSWGSWWRDGTLRLWDGASGALLETVSENDAPRLRADWLAARVESHFPSLMQCGFVGWQVERVAGISSQLSHAGYAALWHAGAHTTARHLLPDGTLVVTLASGQVCFLKLYHGSRRIDLAALGQLMLPADIQ